MFYAKTLVFKDTQELAAMVIMGDNVEFFTASIPSLYAPTATIPSLYAPTATTGGLIDYYENLGVSVDLSMVELRDVEVKFI